MKFTLRRRHAILASAICLILVLIYLNKDRGSVLWRTNLHDGVPSVCGENKGVLTVQTNSLQIYYIKQTTGQITSMRKPKSDQDPALDSIIAKDYSITYFGQLSYRNKTMDKPLIFHPKRLSNYRFMGQPIYSKDKVYASVRIGGNRNVVLIFKPGTLHVIGCADVDPGFPHTFDLAAAECDWVMSSPFVDDKGIIYIGDASCQVYAIKPWFGKY
jgi:hypothetical protein